MGTVREAVNDALNPSASIGDQSRSTQRSETRWRGASRRLRSLINWMPQVGSGRTDLRENERRTLVARSNDAYRNHMVARAAATRLRTNVVGSGVVPHPSVDRRILELSEEQADELNQQIATEWRMWAENPVECDMEGTLDFYGLESLAEISAFLCGDVFVLTPFEERAGCLYGLKLQMIDAARVSNPYGQTETRNLCDGVLLSDTGLPLKYYVRDSHPDDVIQYAGGNIWQEVSVWGSETGKRRAFHVMNDKDQVGKIRGTPGLACILEPLQTLEQFSRAELTAAVVSAMFTVFLKKTKDPYTQAGDLSKAFANQDNREDIRHEEGTSVLQMAPGAILDLDEGEEPSFANPSRPNAQYDPFFMSIVTQMGAALEMPVDELMLRYQNSYTAARAAMLQAYRMYVVRRDHRKQQFYEPAYCLWFDEAVARGRIKVSGYADPARRAAYTQAVWTGPAKGQMDELKEAQAATERIKNGTSNKTIETAQGSGQVWKSVNETAAAERKQEVANGTYVDPNPKPVGAPPKSADPAKDPKQADPTDPEDDDEDPSV
jgi:lambda family phage portal protein